MTPLVCSACGAPNPDTYRFCQRCGTPLPATEPATLDAPEALSADPSTPAPDEGAIAMAEPEEECAAVPDDSVAVVPRADGDMEVAVADPSVLPEELPPVLSPAPGDRDSDNLDTTTPEMPLPTSLPDDSEANCPQGAAPSIDPSTAPGTEPAAPPILQLIGIDYAGRTDRGRERDRNEDAFAVRLRVDREGGSHLPGQLWARGVFVVCDGMGGHARGEVASTMAVELLMAKLQPLQTEGLPGQQTLQEIVHSVNQAIFTQNQAELRRDAGRMGTTMVLLAIDNTRAAIAHVGDSRIYRLTAAGLEQITRDHEVANRLIDGGMVAAEALARPDAHQLTQALGPNDDDAVTPAIAFFEIECPTLFLLCSDGLCDNDVVETHWQEYLLPLLAAEADLEAGAERLIELGNRINGYDNITAVLVRCLVAPAVPREELLSVYTA